jgi:transcriptional regulator GlxA family with amidase domain
MLVAADPDHRIVTAGGASAWEDMALYLISRYCGQGEAVKAAKVFLLGDHSEGQLPYAAMIKPRQHGDAAIAAAQDWIADHYAVANPVGRMVERSDLSERTFKRRFRAATGFSPVEYVQTLRIEEAKQYLETTGLTTEEIGALVGYGDPAFFRRLFKRQSGITPAAYRLRYGGIGSLSSS